MIRQNNKLQPLARVAYVMLIISVVICFLYFARPVIIPIAFSAFIALLVYPLTRWLEGNGFPRIWAIIITFIVIATGVAGVVFLLSREIILFSQDLPDIQDKINDMIEDLEYTLFRDYNIVVDLDESFMKRDPKDLVNSGIFLGTLNTFLDVVTMVGLMPVYIFLMLLYRSSFKAFMLFIVPLEQHKAVRKIIFQVQKVVQNYIVGLLMVMGIVGLLNCLSLYIIGVDYPLFFGFLAAFLMIIPYIGVFIGSLLPALYALVTFDSIGYSLAVIVTFGFIQFLEGNFITPRITGSKVKINPLAAIIALVVGGYLWGMAGLILALPLVAILKVILDNITGMKHLGFLLGSEIYEGSGLNVGSYIMSKKFRIAGWDKLKRKREEEEGDAEIKKEL